MGERVEEALREVLVLVRNDRLCATLVEGVKRLSVDCPGARGNPLTRDYAIWEAKLRGWGTVEPNCAVRVISS